jgi:cytochrome o ubiquinol oxidase operon protein cyoD
MSLSAETERSAEQHATDTAPGDERPGPQEMAQGIIGYVVGLALASALTCVSFFMVGSHLVWSPSIQVAIGVLAIAQMGIHLVFFLHLTSGPDNTNNVMALAFGVLIVMLVMVGSLWIMSHLNHNMMPMDKVMQMQR